MGEIQAFQTIFLTTRNLSLSCQKEDRATACLPLAGQASDSPSYRKSSLSKRQQVTGVNCVSIEIKEEWALVWVICCLGRWKMSGSSSERMANRWEWLARSVPLASLKETVQAPLQVCCCCCCCYLEKWGEVHSSYPILTQGILRPWWGICYSGYHCCRVAVKALLFSHSYYLLSPCPHPQGIINLPETHSEYLIKSVTGWPLLSPWKNRCIVSIIVPHLRSYSSVSAIYCHEII